MLFRYRENNKNKRGQDKKEINCRGQDMRKRNKIYVSCDCTCISTSL